ncbi:MAG: hypothetical protein OXR73_30680 [Myxococcales bacterium]|nr:hypothetical protein [Myxococcales bacterium]
MTQMRTRAPHSPQSIALGDWSHLLASICVLVGGCGEGMHGSMDSTASIPADEGKRAQPGWSATFGCSEREQVGRFQVSFQLASPLHVMRSNVIGQVMDRPSFIPGFDVLMDDGTCQLVGLAYIPSCDPACQAPALCTEDGRCVPQPRPIDVGTVRIKGLSGSVVMEPEARRNHYVHVGTLPWPPLERDSTVSLAASGRDGGAFSATARGIEPLELRAEHRGLNSHRSSAGWRWPVTRGSSFQIDWQSAGVREGVAVGIKLNIDPHGRGLGRVHCSVPDSGSFEIPAPFVDALLDLGASGWPRVTLERYSAGAAELAHGCVELRVASSFTLPVSVSGVISCNADQDCPDDETCNQLVFCDDGEGLRDRVIGARTVHHSEPPPVLADLPGWCTSQADNFSFFVTSLDALWALSGSVPGDPHGGFGGNLGGLVGADAICQRIADATQHGDRTWRAFLSATDDGSGARVDAYERVGEGPWYDAHGRLIASGTAGLWGHRPDGDPAAVADLVDECGVPLSALGNAHDVLTGSRKGGLGASLSREATCLDWTNTSLGPSSGVAAGHSFPRPGSIPGEAGSHWASDHSLQGCGKGSQLEEGNAAMQGCVGCSGGYGALYCFAL